MGCWLVDSNQLVVQRALGDYRQMDPLSQCRKIHVVCANYDAEMSRDSCVQLDEMTTVDRDDCTPQRNRVC